MPAHQAPASTSVVIGTRSAPRHTGCFGRRTLLINLTLQGSFDFSDLFIAAKGFLQPKDHDVFRKVGVRNQIVGALKTNAAIGAAGVSAVVGVDGVVGSEHKPIVGFAFKGVDTPCKGGGHDEEPDWYRVIGLQPVGKGRLAGRAAKRRRRYQVLIAERFHVFVATQT